MNKHDINNFTPDDFISKEDVVKIVDDIKKEADELMIKKIDHYEKELALVREDAQIERLKQDKRIFDLENINREHQKLNGELREDNKKLAKQIDDYTNQLRKAGVI
tara:strand:- start:240 stop:557 length:318 start_codon:yes stop_codon:yes gene_type:complete